ncbi:probable BOI-related E3 ubiquitin-protein ligase 3 [Olea europaea var. sylvestris]|uniref:probable BOI-related E3 ubiquitin-protein ligase 3 n=1 Tax=Olea europaea var. sylvestris TaxID=158386 RepID=UPI000C1D3081|nr:probable BOI-related E3 ubiquitin-protein ligase 3 [Olea europaea var. sylvestris]
MAVQAQNFGFQNMDFNPFDMCGSQDWVIGSDNGLYFQEQTKKIHQVFGCWDNQTSPSPSLPTEFLQSLSSDIQNQRLEMDLLLQLENQRLRSSFLQEETRQQAVLLHKYESRTKTLMLQKYEELAMAKNKTMELQDFFQRAEMEAKIWKEKAIENEATVFNLNNKLNQVIEEDFLMFNNGAQDAVSLCGSSSIKNNTQEEKEYEEQKKKMACKLCQVRNSCVVFFPCRHLCSCKSCEMVLGLCPVCESVKKASLEVTFL